MRAIINEAKDVVIDKKASGIDHILKRHQFSDLDDLFYGRSDGWMSSKAMFQAMSVYGNIYHALIVVNNDVEAVFDVNKEEWEELECDNWNIPTCIFTLRTIGGPYYRSSPVFVDDEARREFWLWWLDVSLPASLNLQTLPVEGENQ